MAVSFFVFFANTPANAAANVGIDKKLCTSMPGYPADMASLCSVNASNIPAFTQVIYAITLTGGSSASSVNLSDTFPSSPNFTPTAANCRNVNGAAFSAPFASTPAAMPTMTFPSITVPAGGQVVCFISGYFNVPGAAGLQNKATVTDSGGSSQAFQNTSVAAGGLQNYDFTVTKTATTDTGGPLDLTGGPAVVHYTITITRTGTGTLYLGSVFQLFDNLSVGPNSMPFTASLVPNSVTCSNSGSPDCPTASGSGNASLTPTPTTFLQWTFPTGQAGTFTAGATITIKFDVLYTRNADVYCTQDHDEIINQAALTFNAPGSTTTLSDANPQNNTASVTTPVVTGLTSSPLCHNTAGAPKLEITKTKLSPSGNGPFTWGQTINYQIKIKNVSGGTINNITAYDIVQSEPWSPQFTATMLPGSTCSPGCVITPTSPQNVTGYWQMAPIAHVDIASLANSNTVVWNVSIKYEQTSCRTGSSNPPNDPANWIRNIAYAGYVDANGDEYGWLSQPVRIKLASVPQCNFLVTKYLPGGPLSTVDNRITFGQPFSYTVTYKNAGTSSLTVGTLIDALRIVNTNYALSLPVNYSYSCSGAGVTMPNPTGSGTVGVTHTGQPDQGVRLIQAGSPGVTFAAGATLTCTVTITVSQPPPNNPYCLGAQKGFIENTALMDMSTAYNSNVPWPPSPSYSNTSMMSGDTANWATIRTNMPRCFNLLINKSVSPTVTWASGGPNLTYTITVTNLGDALTGALPYYLADSFLSSMPGTLVGTPTISGGSGTFVPPSIPGYNPFKIKITSLGHNQTMTITFTLQGPFAAGSYTNQAGTFASGFNPGEVYAANSESCNTMTLPSSVMPPGSVEGTCSQATALVLKMAPMTVKKVITATAPATTTVPNGTQFPMQFSCTYPTIPAQTNTQPISPSAPNFMSYQAVVPVGSTCTVSETQITGHIAMPSCPSGYAKWDAPTYPNPPGPNGATNSRLVIDSTSQNTLTVANNLRCEANTNPGVLTVKKTVTDLTGLNPMPSTVFSINVTCTNNGATTNNQTLTFNYPGSLASQTVQNIPLGAVCKVQEASLPPHFPPQGASNCPVTVGWGTPGYPNPLGPDHTTQTTTVVAGTNTLEVHNTFICDSSVGYLLIQKTLASNGIPLSQANFTFSVNCTLNGATVYSGTSYIAFPTNMNMAVPVLNLPNNAVCTVTEQQPVAVLPAPPCSPPQTGMAMGFVPSYPNGNSGTIHPMNGNPGGPTIVQVKNTRTCVPTPPIPQMPPPPHGGGNGDKRTYDIGVTKTASGIWQTNTPSAFTIAVTNHGDAFKAPVKVSVTDVLPAGMNLVSASGSGWNCTRGRTVACTYSGAVEKGKRLPPITVMAVPTRPGPAQNCAIASLQDARDATPGNNTGCVTIRVNAGKGGPAQGRPGLPGGGNEGPGGPQGPNIPSLPKFPSGGDGGKGSAATP